MMPEFKTPEFGLLDAAIVVFGVIVIWHGARQGLVRELLFTISCYGAFGLAAIFYRQVAWTIGYVLIMPDGLLSSWGFLVAFLGSFAVMVFLSLKLYGATKFGTAGFIDGLGGLVCGAGLALMLVTITLSIVNAFSENSITELVNSSVMGRMIAEYSTIVFSVISPWMQGATPAMLLLR